jgi:hypothetical protein
MGEPCWLSSTRNTCRARVYSRSFHVRNGNARPWTRRGNGFLRHSLRWGGPPSTHLRACGLTIVEAGERSSDCALLRSALLLARSQLNSGVKQHPAFSKEQRLTSPRLPLLVFAAAVVATTFQASLANAQVRPGALPAAFVSDSIAWQRILIYVVSSLSPHLVRTASDTSRQPWRIGLPPDEPRRAVLEAHLRTILRARPVVPADTVVYELEIGPLAVANDTGRVRVRTDLATRCSGTTRSAGYGNVDRVYVVRLPPGVWSIARTEGVLHGDRFGCPSPPR